MNPTRESSSIPGCSKQEFLGRIRQALSRAQTRAPGQIAAAPDPAIVRVVDAQSDLMDRFIQTASATGMKVTKTDSDRLLKDIAALVKELQIKRLVVGAGSVPQALGLSDLLRRLGVELVNWKTPANPDRSADEVFDVDAGITDVHAAIAETGSLICCSDSGHARSLSLVVPIHIALVKRSDILPDLLDFWSRWSSKELPASLAVITGPSKTADIEGILITGVHGPGQVHLMVIADA